MIQSVYDFIFFFSQTERANYHIMKMKCYLHDTRKGSCKMLTYMEFSFEQLWLFLDLSYTVHKVYIIVKKVHPAFNLAADQTSPLLQECTGSTTKEGSSQTFCLVSSYSWAASWKKPCPFPVHRDFPVYILGDRFLPWQGE